MDGQSGESEEEEVMGEKIGEPEMEELVQIWTAGESIVILFVCQYIQRDNLCIPSINAILVHAY